LQVNYTCDAWAIEVDEEEEAALFFDPRRGNVAFGSAIDGWAATLDDFAALHAVKLGVSRALLRRALWGNYYYQPKTKKIVTGAAAAAANKGKPLAVSLFLERLWAVYDAVLVNPDEVGGRKGVHMPKGGTNARSCLCILILQTVDAWCAGPRRKDCGSPRAGRHNPEARLCPWAGAEVQAAGAYRFL